MEPIIVSAVFEPNPAGAGGEVVLRVIAMDAEPHPAGQIVQSGEFRVQVGGVWYPLTYDPAERCYRALLPTGATSADQPGGYFNAMVEAVNDGGKTVSIDGHALPSLRLVVKDLTAPELVLTSPPEGYLTTHAPQIMVEITDNASGVEPATVAATAEGGALPVETAEIPGGYRATVSPTWDDGPHRVVISATDRDGNTGRLTLHYTVDTVPPELCVWDHRLVVDTETVTIRGTAQDSAGAAVTVSAGKWSTDTTPAADGSWRAAVPLAVGVNEIAVKAWDGAGLTTAWTGTVVSLITDRTTVDLTLAKDLLRRIPAGTATAEELERYNRGELRGSYDFADLNRVGAAVALLTPVLRAQGYLVDTAPRTDWAAGDVQTETPMGRYLADVRQIAEARQTLRPVTLPETMGALTLAGANRIELALVAADEVTPVLKRSYIYAGEAMAGEF